MVVDRAAFDRGTIKSFGRGSRERSAPPAYNGYSQANDESNSDVVEVAMMCEVGDDDLPQLYAIPADHESFKASQTGLGPLSVSNPTYHTPAEDGSIYVIPRDDNYGDTYGDADALGYIDLAGAESLADRPSKLPVVYSLYGGADSGDDAWESRNRLASTV